MYEEQNIQSLKNGNEQICNNQIDFTNIYAFRKTLEKDLAN